MFTANVHPEDVIARRQRIGIMQIHQPSAHIIYAHAAMGLLSD